MAVITHDAKLNQLLVDLGRSLLQYAGESSLWSQCSTRGGKLLEIADKQQRHVARIAELLMDRGWPIDFGTYPTEYTDLHFVSLDYLLPQVLNEQRLLVTELDEAVHTCIDDSVAVELLREILAGEREVLASLESLASPVAPVAN